MTWIEPAEQMPPIETEVLVTCQWGVCMGETMEDDNGNPAWLVSLGNRYVDCYTVTAWMYKPEKFMQKQRADLSEKLLTPKQTAELLQVSRVTLWAWEKQGRVTKYTIGGRTYFKHGEIMQGLETLQRSRKDV
jgi:hypothetical protein